MSKKILAAEQQPIVGATSDAGTYERIALKRIRISQDNRKRFNQVALEELGESIKAIGVVQPIVLRPVAPTEDDPTDYEIVAGERRFRGSALAGMVDIPAMVRTLTDLQAAKIRILENLQREDPHPMEEAEGYQLLMQKHGYNADQLAEEIKKSRSYVFGRLKLCSLTTDVREQFLDDKVPASIALMIARIPVPAMQVKALAEIITPQYGEALSVRRAAQHLQDRYMLDLTAATFPIADAKLLATAGACTKCPKRTGNQPEIYEGISADVCTDPDCFSEKKAALVTRKIADANKKGLPVLETQEEWKALAQSDNLVTARADLWMFERAAPATSRWRQLEDLTTEDQLPEPRAYAIIAGALVPMYEKNAVQLALEKAGICETVEGRSARETAEAIAAEAQSNGTPKAGTAPNAKRLAAMKAEAEAEQKKERTAHEEQGFRISLYKQFRSRAANGLSLQSLREFVKLVLVDDNSYTLPNDVLDVYGLASYSDEAVAAHIDQADLPEVQLILIDLVLGDCLAVDARDVNDDGTFGKTWNYGSERLAALNAMASHEGIDPVAAREQFDLAALDIEDIDERYMVRFLRAYPERINELTKSIIDGRPHLLRALEIAAKDCGFIYVGPNTWTATHPPIGAITLIQGGVATGEARDVSINVAAAPPQVDGDAVAIEGEDLEAAIAEPAPSKKAPKSKSTTKKAAEPDAPGDQVKKTTLSPAAAWPFPKSSAAALKPAEPAQSTAAQPTTKEAA